MATLSELKNKWFIPMDGSSPNHVPQRRHPTSTLSVSTDGNHVELLVDGQNYMMRWYDRLGLLGSLGSTNDEFFHAGWRFEAVRPMGHTNTTQPDALQRVIDANGRSVDCYPLLDGNFIIAKYNLPSSVALGDGGVTNASRDRRFPPAGSNHHKFAVMKHQSATDTSYPVAVIGSIDIAKTRWDTTSHLTTNPDRDPTHGKLTHDSGVAVKGPGVADIESTFRDRWNDSSRTFGMLPDYSLTLPLITSPVCAPAPLGTHSVQALCTYGVTSKFFGYSWSPTGEFTVWAAYLNAIKKASTYIYVEDQYFLPFDWPPKFGASGSAQETDIVYQLGEAIKRGVRVAVLTPGNSEDFGRRFQKYQRDVGINYLNSIVAAGAPGDFVVASLQQGTVPIYVHSKLMIIDDEVIFIGSANVCQRSMTHDGELQLAIVDAAETLPRQFRKAMWEEHSQRAIDDSPIAAYAAFKADVAAGHGRLQQCPFDANATYPATAGSTGVPVGHVGAIRNAIDPYAGPAGIR